MFPEDDDDLADLKKAKQAAPASQTQHLPSMGSAAKTRSPEGKSLGLLMKPISKSARAKGKTEYAKRVRKFPELPRQPLLLLDSPSTTLEENKSKLECHTSSQVRDEFFEQMYTQDDNSGHKLLACREKVYH